MKDYPKTLWFEYNALAAKDAKDALGARRADYDNMEPLTALAAYLRETVPKAGDPLALFYGMMEWRRFYPNFFLAPDLYLLVANIALNRAESFRLLDWEMLPAACLLASAKKQVILPEGKALRPRLAQFFSNVSGSSRDMLLGTTTALHLPGDKLVEELRGSSGGIFLCGWDFLGYKSEKLFRETLLGANLVQAALQLPKPKRQPGNTYPAVLLAGENPDGIVRLAKVDVCGNGPGGLNQTQCLDALADNSTDVIVAEIYKDSQCKLTRAGTVAPAIGPRVRDFAQIFRCLAIRAKVPGRAEEGEEIDGCLIGREISTYDIDPLTGFIKSDGGTLTAMEIKKLTQNQRNAFLRKNGILMPFRGAESTLGMVGLYLEETPVPLPCRSLCIVRALKNVSPVWLFEQLRRPIVAETIRAHASGNVTLVTSLEIMRNIPVTPPDPETVAELEKMHAEVLARKKEIDRLAQEVWDIRKAMQEKVD